MNQGMNWNCSCGAVSTDKFCSNCGAAAPPVTQNSGQVCSCGTMCECNFCPNCGRNVQSAPPQQYQADVPPPPQPQPYQQPPPYPPYNHYQPMQNAQSGGRGMAIAALILGIVAMTLPVPYIDIIIGGLGLVFAAWAKQKGFTGGLRTAGFVLSIIGTVVAVIYSLSHAMGVMMGSGMFTA